MVKSFLKRLIEKNRDFILHESQEMQDFFRILMKPRNTGVKWTGEEICQLKSHLKHLSLSVPVLIIFTLPFGSLLLPVLAEVLDRRKKRRMRQGIV